MNKKIFAILALLIVILCCLSVVSADNDTDDVQTSTDDDTVETTTDTTDNSGNDSNSQTVDLSNYITAVSIGATVTFSDGFTGFSLDPSKGQITDQDGFTATSTSGVPQANYLKLAVVESYKAGNEGDIGSVLSSFVDGSYQSSSNPVVQNVLSSSDSIGDYEVVKINNNTEATFEFEVLEPVDSNKPSYFAYRVSFNTIPDEKLSATQGDDVNGSDNDTAVSSVENDTTTSKNVENDTPTTQNVENDTQTSKNVENDTPVKSNTDNNVSKDSSKTADNDTNKTNKTDNNTSKKTTNKTDKKTTNNTSKKTTNNTKKPVKKENTKTEPKKTVVNKTTTKADNEKNAQPENHKNVKNYNERPQQAQQNRLQEVGRPIAILIAVAVLGGAIAIVLHRKD